MAERINRGHNKLQEWGLKGAALVALGAVALTGCGTEKAGAGHSPDRPAASASATPGSNESSQTPSETASSSPETAKSFEMGATKLANSQVYNELDHLDQTSVEKNSQLNFEDFEHLPPEERALVARVLSDAHWKEYLHTVGELVVPGGGRDPVTGEPMPLKKSYIPVEEKYTNAAQDAYDWAMNSTPEDVTASNNAHPLFQVQFERAIAVAMASTGKADLLEDAKKIIGGSLYHGAEQVVGGGPAYDVDEWGHLTNRIKDLRQINDSKTDPLPYLGYPLTGSNRHSFTPAPSGPFAGYPSVVSLGFENYNPDTHTNESGPNIEGALSATYKFVPYKTADGHDRVVWTEYQANVTADAVELVNNPTS